MDGVLRFTYISSLALHRRTRYLQLKSQNPGLYVRVNAGFDMCLPGIAVVGEYRPHLSPLEKYCSSNSSECILVLECYGILLA